MKGKFINGVMYTAGSAATTALAWLVVSFSCWACSGWLVAQAINGNDPVFATVTALFIVWTAWRANKRFHYYATMAEQLAEK